MTRWFIALYSQSPGSVMGIKTEISSVEVSLPLRPHRLLTLSLRLRRKSRCEIWCRRLSAGHIYAPSTSSSTFPSFHFSPPILLLSFISSFSISRFFITFDLHHFYQTDCTFSTIIHIFHSWFHWPRYGNNEFPRGKTRFQFLRVYLIWMEIEPWMMLTWQPIGRHTRSVRDK